MNRLRNALIRLSADLEALHARWALIGGLAVSALTSPRYTDDVDVVIAVSGDSEAEALFRSLLDRGYRQLPNGIHERKDTGRLALVQLQSPIDQEGGIRVDLMFAWSLVEPEIVERARYQQIQPGLQGPVARIGDMIALKIQAGRSKDESDILMLLRAADEVEISHALATMELMRERGGDDEKNLLGEFRRYLASSKNPPT